MFANKRDIREEMNNLIRRAYLYLSRQRRQGETIEKGECRILLQNYRWDYLTLAAMTHNRSVTDIQFEANLKKNLTGLNGIFQNECASCNGELDRQNEYCFALDCTHWFCLKCWKAHFLEMFKMKKRQIECMEYECELVFHDEKIIDILRKTDTPLDDFEDWKLEVYINENSYKECPQDGCPLYVRILKHTKRARKVLCKCDTSIYIHRCCQEWHAPVPCELWKMWHRHQPAREDTLEDNGRHYKHCPNLRCGIPIERNQGCLHMTCPRCRYEFCYACLEYWRSEAHTGADFVCRNIRAGNILSASEETLLFRDLKFKINFKWFQKYKNSEYRESVAEGVNRNIEVLKRFNMAAGESYLQKLLDDLFDWSDTIMCFYVFDFFVRFSRKEDKLRLDNRIKFFRDSWRNLAQRQRFDLRLAKNGQNIRNWLDGTKSLAGNVKKLHEECLTEINKFTGNCAYVFRCRF